MLVVALILMAVIALALTSYLGLSLSSARLSQRSHGSAAAFHLAEAGAEEALWSFNRTVAGATDAWRQWEIHGSDARRTIEGFDFGGNTRGRVQIHVGNYQPAGRARPLLVSLSTVETPGMPAIRRMVEITLRRRSRFTAALAASKQIVFSGLNTSVDSWNSDPDGDRSTPPIDFDSALRNDRGIVASTGVENRAMLVNQAEIFGYVYTSGPSPEVGVSGSIRGHDTPADVRIDSQRVTTDFSADFPPVTAPVDGTPIAEIGATLGTVGEATKWRCEGLSLSGSETLTILGDVTLVLTAGSGSRVIDVIGNAGIVISENASLTVYAEGNILIAGRGITNRNVEASRCRIFGTNTSVGGQSLHLAGSGQLRAAVYAPNASVKIDGNGDMMGAVVGKDITLTGNAAFHYDEALENLDENLPYRLDGWRELISESDQAPHAAKFAH